MSLGFLTLKPEVGSYFITFTDYHSQYGYIHLIKYESKAFEKFNEFRLELKKLIGYKIESLRSDRGVEYLSGEGYVLETTTMLLNVALSKIVAKALYGLWHGKPTFYKYLRYIYLRTSSSLGLNGFINESLEPMGIAEVTTFKVRLMAKGYTQRPDMDFEETNLPIAIAKSIQILLAIDYEICIRRVAGETHWTAVKTILNDASFQSDVDDAKSQSDYVLKLNGGVVAWKSSKQDTVVTSAIEADYIATLKAANEKDLMKN
ncbi:hypothetical protein Sango_0664500 [Sesamum angolense]|uniref:Uncharacterized protein n=1 Tax=Sesamum angolense TaxID=2727404 RepID=A0AAE2C2R2_9LAMI|nr:hypothetical protein Sango_0664500 [Sesamum angolense]